MTIVHIVSKICPKKYKLYYVWKSLKQVSFWLYLTSFFGKLLLEVKQCYQTGQLSIRQKMIKNAKIWILDLNETFFGDFQTLSKYDHSIQLEKVKREKKNWVDVKVFPYPTCDKVLKKFPLVLLDPPRHWCCHKEVHCKMEKTSSWPSK